MPKKKRYALVILGLFAASALGGALATIVFQPKEACAGCATMLTKGAGVYLCTCSCQGTDGCFYVNGFKAISMTSTYDCGAYTASCATQGFLVN